MARYTGYVHLEPMDQVDDVEEVFLLLGKLHQSQAALFRQRGVEIALPGFDLEDYTVDMIKVGNNETAGILLTRESGCFADTRTISDIVLYESWRGMGIGGQALAIILERMENDGVGRVNLNVHADNERAIRLYESLGFETDSKHMSMRL